MKITNNQADYYLSVLKIISKKITGKFGYAVARNIRLLESTLTEFTEVKNKLIMQYGERTEGGFSLSCDSPNYKLYKDEIKVYENIEHEVDLMSIEPNEIFDSPITADIISEILFMIKEEGVNNG